MSTVHWSSTLSPATFSALLERSLSLGLVICKLSRFAVKIATIIMKRLGQISIDNTYLGVPSKNHGIKSPMVKWAWRPAAALTCSLTTEVQQPVTNSECCWHCFKSVSVSTLFFVQFHLSMCLKYFDSYFKKCEIQDIQICYYIYLPLRDCDLYFIS